MAEFSWVSAKSGGARTTTALFGISLSGKSGHREFSVILYTGGMKLTRWLKGDKVSIGFDLESGLIGVRRDPRGFTLCANGGQASGRPKSLRVTCKAPRQLAPFPRITLEPSDAQMVDDVLVISLPYPCTFECSGKPR